MGLFYHNSIFKTVISSYSYDTIKSIRNYLIQKRTSNRGYYIYPSGKKKGLYVIDIFNELSDKGEALKILKEIYKFDFIVSIGDYLNDIGMFKVSDISIAMNHSPDKVKQQANFTIKNLGELLSCIKI
jgi:hydroxymethylpyrimidine pyrophosphatase-like HAD family hydrolase